ncbi:ArsR/SmtB family transcription factor [Streptomyces sp. NPDC057854]|uniref:ArsR/SmtB family transcription factor n=1 Tax=unclassified Streptomyces TaxID=2593676 RepID=UPI0036A29CBF
MTAAGTDDLGEASNEILEEAAALFGLLASPVRLRVLQILSRGESSVAVIAEQAGGALSTISQHLSSLKLSGLVGARREGRRQVYFATDPDVIAVVQVVVRQLAAQAGAKHALPPGPRRNSP